jgi:hypothetical protein
LHPFDHKSTAPPPPLPQPTTWRAGERPSPQQHSKQPGRSHNNLPFSPSPPNMAVPGSQGPPSPAPTLHHTAATPYASPYAAPSDVTIPGTQDGPPSAYASPYAANSDVSIPMTPMTNATSLLSPSSGPRWRTGEAYKGGCVCNRAVQLQA